MPFGQIIPGGRLRSRRSDVAIANTRKLDGVPYSQNAIVANIRRAALQYQLSTLIHNLS